MGEKPYANGGLKGRVAVVTGGAKGIGQAYAARLAQDGAQVAVGDITDAGEAVKYDRASGRRSRVV